MASWRTRYRNEHTKVAREAIRGLKATMTATALEHPERRARMPRKSSSCLQRQGRSKGIPTTAARMGTSTRSGRQVLHTIIRGTAHSTKMHLWMRPMAPTSNGWRTLGSPSSAGLNRIVSRILNRKKGQIFLPGTHGTSATGARTRESRKDHSRALLVSYAPKPEEISRKKDPQVHFL